MIKLTPNPSIKRAAASQPSSSPGVFNMGSVYKCMLSLLCLVVASAVPAPFSGSGDQPSAMGVHPTGECKSWGCSLPLRYKGEKKNNPLMSTAAATVDATTIPSVNSSPGRDEGTFHDYHPTPSSTIPLDYNVPSTPYTIPDKINGKQIPSVIYMCYLEDLYDITQEFSAPNGTLFGWDEIYLVVIV